MAKSISFSFGRFNPPTIGHEKLMDQTRKANRNYRIYASQSQDAKKNPLNFRSKVSIMKAMFPIHARSISTDKVKTAIDVMVNLYKENYTDVVMVVGSDRVGEFEKLLNAYNGKKARHGYYKFKSIRVISAGERDPDAEGVTGMSASKMRKAAQDNDYTSFQRGLPKKFKQGQTVFKALQKAMSVKSLKEFIEESRMTSTGFAVAMKDPKGWKIVFKGNSRDQDKEIKKLKKAGKKLGKDFRGYRTYKPVGYLIKEEIEIEEGRPNRVAKSLSDPKYRAKTEKDKKKEMKKGNVKHKGRMHEKIMTFKQAQEKDKKDQNKDPVGKCHEDITNEGFFDMFFKKEMAASKKAVYKREYTAAAKMYNQFIKRGDSAGVALHRAASSFKHVSDRGLQQFLKR
jgi:nicotinic acid mononucleotide adenylyltransferase